MEHTVCYWKTEPLPPSLTDWSHLCILPSGVWHRERVAADTAATLKQLFFYSEKLPKLAYIAGSNGKASSVLIAVLVSRGCVWSTGGPVFMLGSQLKPQCW